MTRRRDLFGLPLLGLLGGGKPRPEILGFATELRAAPVRWTPPSFPLPNLASYSFKMEKGGGGEFHQVVLVDPNLNAREVV